MGERVVRAEGKERRWGDFLHYEYRSTINTVFVSPRTSNCIPIMILMKVFIIVVSNIYRNQIWSRQLWSYCEFRIRLFRVSLLRPFFHMYHWFYTVPSTIFLQFHKYFCAFLSHTNLKKIKFWSPIYFIQNSSYITDNICILICIYIIL